MRSIIMLAAAALTFAVSATNSSAVTDARRDLCGQSSRQSAAIGPATPPFGPALQLVHVSAARTRIAFVPRLPAGRPFRVFVSREREVRLRRLGLTYRSSPANWFHLTQGRLLVSVGRFEQSLQELAARDLCGARSSTFRLRDGTLALLTEAKDRRLVVFRHAQLELMLLTSPGASSVTRLRALANALSESTATADIRHGFDMRQLPYPHGALFTVTVARASGPVPRFRRSWSRLSSDVSYTGGLAGNAKLGTLTLRPDSNLVSGSTRPITDKRAGSSTLGPPEARCTRSIEVAAAAQVRIVVFAKSGRPCSIKVTIR